MISIIQATTRDIPLIHDMASIVFPHTYRSLLSKEQLDFMMEWMYSYDNLKRQMLEENNTYYIAYVDGAAAGCTARGRRWWPSVLEVAPHQQ